MNLFQEISENKFVLVLLSEKQYEEKLAELMRKIEKDHTKICYVCLSKPYGDTIEYLQSNGLDVGKFFFIDMLTSHYKSPRKAENCIFIEAPGKLIALQVAISKAVSEKNCSVVVFDTLSSLLMYEQTHDIVKFTHQVTIEESNRNINKVFIVLKEGNLPQEYSQAFIKDVEMFADKKIEFLEEEE